MVVCDGSGEGVHSKMTIADVTTPHRNRLIVLRNVREFLRDSFWPLVFLSWLPFISSNLILLDFVLARNESVEHLAGLSRVFPNYSLPVALTLGSLGLVCALMSRRPTHIIALLPWVALVYSAYALGVAEAADASATQLKLGAFSSFRWLYAALTLMSIVYFCFAGQIFDSFFIPFIGLALVDGILALFEVQFSFYGFVLENYFPSIVGVVLSFMGIFFLRSAVLAYRDNRGLHRKFGGELRPAAWRAFRLWWPMLAFFVVMWSLYHALNVYITRPALIEYLHNYEYYQSVALSQAEAAKHPEPVSETATVESELLALIERSSAQIKTSTDAKIADLSGRSAEAMTATKDNAANELRGALPPRFPGTDQHSCGFFDIGCHLANGVKSMMNSAYQRSRDRQLGEMQNSLNRLNAEGQQANQEITAQVASVAQRRIDAISNMTSASVIQIAKAALISSFILGFYSILILLKSFLVVFARVIYLTHTISSASGTKSKFGRVRAVGCEHEIDASDARKYFVRPDAIGNNVIDRKRLPHPSRLPLSRLFSGNYIMCYIDPSASREPSYLKVDKHSSIVVWELEPGEKVIFNVRDMIGFSDSVTIGSEISLRLSSLVFGRVVYRHAIGPGVILMKTRDEAVAGQKGEAQSALHTSGLVAWNATNEFNVISWPSIIDTFFSGCSLKKGADGLLVYDQDVSRRRSGPLQGIWKTGRTFLLPF